MNSQKTGEPHRRWRRPSTGDPWRALVRPSAVRRYRSLGDDRGGGYRPDYRGLFSAHAHAPRQRAAPFFPGAPPYCGSRAVRSRARGRARTGRLHPPTGLARGLRLGVLPRPTRRAARCALRFLRAIGRRRFEPELMDPEGDHARPMLRSDVESDRGAPRTAPAAVAERPPTASSGGEEHGRRPRRRKSALTCADLRCEVTRSFADQHARWRPTF